MALGILPGASFRAGTGIRSRCLFHWRAHDLSLTAITGESATFARAGTGTATDVNGTSRTLVHSAPRWEMLDTDGDSVRETPHLKLGGAAASETIKWAFTALPTAMTVLVDFVEQGSLATISAGVFYIGLDAGTGARLVIDSTGTQYRATHHNGTSSVTSTMSGTAPTSGQRTQLRLTLASTGAIQLHQTITTGSETSATASGTLALGAAWGDTIVRLNNVGTGNEGTNAFRSLRIAGGVRSLTAMQGLV